ncbi:cell surface A33 antigen-like [Mugil cephalus]|uniref:cell surface A33 antigen-like n=1 Tax=Mugil cephalus TaxID=48193 RepID=UPI001FB7C339|nr:cell surface A33 antigen-like [Mugil cephalus]
MKAFSMERRIFILIQLYLGLSGVGALTVKIPQTQYEYARGDNVMLPCTFSSTVRPIPLIIITWSAYAVNDISDERTQILTYYYPNNITDIKNEYEGRLSLDFDLNTGKANLRISSITLVDNENFECRVNIPGDDEGEPFDSTRLVVLVAPSTPICKIQGKAEYGQNINLTCKSEEGSPPPTYTWTSKDAQGTPRPLDPRNPPKGGVMSLYNISKDTSGYFKCVSENKIRSDFCNITLKVMPPSMNIGSTAGIIGGAVAVLIILIIVIYCCCCRKKNKEEEYAMGNVEDEYHDQESNPEKQEKPRSNDDSNRPAEGRDRYDERGERVYDRPQDYDDRRSDYDDRRSDYDDRRSDYNDRRSDYNDRRSDYDDRRSDYTARRSDYDDRRSDFDDRRSDYNDRRSDYDDRRYDDRRDPRYADDDRYDEPHNSLDRNRPPVPNNKPPRRDYDK